MCARPQRVSRPLRPVGFEAPEPGRAAPASGLERLAAVNGRPRAQFRGNPRVLDDTAVRDAGIASGNLILWGDADSDRVPRRIAAYFPATPAAILIHPDPRNPSRYVLLSTRFPFREDPGSTDSRQMPPNHAVVNLKTSLGSHSPRRIALAGFINEEWGC